jgi:O-antigen ligase
MVVHGPIAVNNYWALIVFIDMVMNFIVYLSLIHFVNDQDKYDKLLKTWLGIHVFLAIIGIVKHGRGIGGFLGDENDFCLALNMVIPFPFFFAITSSGKKRIYYVALTCLFLFVIMLTGSRGGFVGLCTTFVYCWFRSKQKILVTFIIIVLSIFAYFAAPKTYIDRIHSITEQGTSSGTGEARTYTWGIGWHMFLDNPIMGVGQGNFPSVFKKYEFQVTGSDTPFHGRSVAGRAAHSVYFTLLPELGLMGTIPFLLIILYTFKDLKHIKKIALNNRDTKVSFQPDRFYYIALALEGSLITYLVSSVFISTLYYPNLWFLIGFIMAYKKIVASKEDSAASLSYT